jgi:hypothetical protein
MESITDSSKRENQWFTPSHAAKLFPLVKGKRLHVNSIWRWMANGKLKWRRLGGRRIISLKAIQDFCRATGRESLLDHIVRAADAEEESCGSGSQGPDPKLNQTLVPAELGLRRLTQGGEDRTDPTTNYPRREGQWFTPSHVVDLFPLINGKRVTVSSVWRWMSTGQLKWEKLGGRRIISLQAIQDFCRASGRESQVAHIVRAAAVRELWCEVL